jgi:predicted component of type VI protein secretion system
MAQFRLVVRSGPVIGKFYLLEGPEISIGRDNTNTIAINDAEVSRRHARMELRGATYAIQDLGSTNGTFVNGTRVNGMQPLTPGDSVAFGEGIVLGFENAVDMNATVLSSKPPQTAVQPSAPASPLPAPVPSAPAPVPPAAPRMAPMPPAAPRQVPMPPPVARPAPVPPPVAKSGPAPVYSGQVPTGPVAIPDTATPKKKKFPIWIIIVILLLVIICACGAFFWVIDYLKLWCKVVPFLVPLLGGTC